MLRALSSLNLNASGDGTPTTSLGNLLQHFHTLILKIFFLIFCLHLSSSAENSYSFVLLPLSLPQHSILSISLTRNYVNELVMLPYPRASLPLFHFVSISTMWCLLILRKDVKQKKESVLSATFSTWSTAECCCYIEIMSATCHFSRILTLLF